ncbi:hypothetical protein FXO37_33626 [Capsicum annuum]|nr:hypothetical protein FXO37_33626 [Capsicum annuum]
MLDIVPDGDKLILRINVVPGSPTIPPPQPTIDEHDLFEDESLDTHPMDLEDHSMELKNKENHIYPIAFCVIDKENDAFWTFFFEKMKSIMVDGSYLFFISDRHKSITNGIAKAYNHDHHRYYKRHLGENLRIFSSSMSLVLRNEVGHIPGNRFDMMTKSIAESVNAMLISERDYPVVSIFNSIAKRFGEIFRERRAYVLKYKDNKFVPAAEKILRENMSEGGFFYMENISGDEKAIHYVRQWKFDLGKIPCDHVMAALRLKYGDDYGLRVYDYSSTVYKVEEYFLVYSESINVVPLESE